MALIFTVVCGRLGQGTEDRFALSLIRDAYRKGKWSEMHILTKIPYHILDG